MPVPFCALVGVLVPFVCVPPLVPACPFVVVDVVLLVDLGIFALLKTSAMSSGNVSHVPLRRSSRERARTRSVQPVRASESESKEERSGIEEVVRRWAIRASCVAEGSVGVVEEREMGRGIGRGAS